MFFLRVTHRETLDKIGATEIEAQGHVPIYELFVTAL